MIATRKTYFRKWEIAQVESNMQTLRDGIAMMRCRVVDWVGWLDGFSVYTVHLANGRAIDIEESLLRKHNLLVSLSALMRVKE